MQPIQEDIQAIRSQIEALQQERASLVVAPVIVANDSPQEITEAYRRHARESAEISAELEGIDNAIAALEAKLKQLESSQGVPLQPLQMERRANSLQEQVEEHKQRAQVHAERINELSAELAKEVQALKAIADELSPSYWKLYDKPFITGFSRVTVPHVRSDGAVWTIVNRVV